MSISDNIRIIRNNITRVASQCGREPADITLLAVTKTVSIDLIQIAVDTGIRDIGENRVQEARMKFSELARPVNWHLIGHLQTNKVKHAIPLFDLIHSVDRMDLVDEIQKRARTLNKIQRVLVQVNTSGEESKSGCQPEEAEDLVKSVSQFENLQIEGLMTIGPLSGDRDKIRSSFKCLNEIFKKIKNSHIPNVTMKHLSMGMSQDYELAIEEGSTLIRVGTAIFGQRQQ